MHCSENFLNEDGQSHCLSNPFRRGYNPSTDAGRESYPTLVIVSPSTPTIETCRTLPYVSRTRG